MRKGMLCASIKCGCVAGSALLAIPGNLPALFAAPAPPGATEYELRRMSRSDLTHEWRTRSGPNISQPTRRHCRLKFTPLLPKPKDCIIIIYGNASGKVLPRRL